MTAEVALARVLAHCGGNLSAAVQQLVGSIATAPGDPEPYAMLAELWRDRPRELADVTRGDSLQAVLALSYVNFLRGDMDDAAMALGSVVGARADIPWADAPWFGDDRFLGTVSADALAEAAMRTMDHGADLDSDTARERFRPWFHAIDVVSARQPSPEALARMAILLRACGLTDASFALCDQADSVEPRMMTEVVRAGTWRKLGDIERTATSFERALALDPANWSLHLDLADIRAQQGDFEAAVRLTAEGTTHAPTEPVLLTAHAAYRTRLTGSPSALHELLDLARKLPRSPYRDLLIDHACEGPGLSARLVRAARKVQQS